MSVMLASPAMMFCVSSTANRDARCSNSWPRRAVVLWLPGSTPHHEPRSSRREEAPSPSAEKQSEPPHVGCYGSGVQSANCSANSHPGPCRKRINIPHDPHPASGHVDSLASARSAHHGLSAPPNSFRRLPNGSSLPLLRAQGIGRGGEDVPGRDPSRLHGKPGQQTIPDQHV